MFGLPQNHVTRTRPEHLCPRGISAPGGRGTPPGVCAAGTEEERAGWRGGGAGSLRCGWAPTPISGPGAAAGAVLGPGHGLPRRSTRACTATTAPPEEAVHNL